LGNADGSDDGANDVLFGEGVGVIVVFAVGAEVVFEADGALEMVGACETVGTTVRFDVGAIVLFVVGELDGTGEVTLAIDGALVDDVGTGVGASV